MNQRVIFFVYFLIGVFVSLMMPRGVYASGEFQADYNVQYAISPAGTTIVTQNITLTNKQSNLYPQKYSIVLDTTNIKNVIAYDSHEVVAADISQKNGKTQIVLTFNDKVVGLGRQLAFTLRFENADIAQKNGSIWEVNVPGITRDADIASYDVTLSVPQSFGPNAYMSPLPSNGTRWTRDQMMAGGISAAYGSAQAFDIALTYFIENPTVTGSQTEIALPPDTAYQTVIIDLLEPRPSTVNRDTDGNWMAVYELLPGQRKSITARIHVLVSLQPKEGYTDTLTDVSLYTRGQKYWETSDEKIAALAKTYTTPRAIYNYVVSALSYDFTRVQESPIRKGALGALATPENSVCMEFTDLFIAIARAAGIPAREAVGFAYTTNARLRPLSLVSDVLHAWPEYYDKDAHVWIPVDPTWGNTTGGVNYFDKLDFNHIVFAVHGKQSDYPYPAGFYRKSGKTTNDVVVQFAKSPVTATAGKLSPSFSFPKRVIAGITARGSVTFENTRGVSIPQASISIQSSPVDVSYMKTVERVSPFAKFSVPIALTIPNYLARGTGRIVVTVGGQSDQFLFDIAPITAYFIIPIISFGAILVISAVMIVRSVPIWKHHRKR